MEGKKENLVYQFGGMVIKTETIAQVVELLGKKRAAQVLSKSKSKNDLNSVCSCKPPLPASNLGSNLWYCLNCNKSL
jgi:hypothetical protein